LSRDRTRRGVADVDVDVDVDGVAQVGGAIQRCYRPENLLIERRCGVRVDFDDAWLIEKPAAVDDLRAGQTSIAVSKLTWSTLAALPETFVYTQEVTIYEYLYTRRCLPLRTPLACADQVVGWR